MKTKILDDKLEETWHLLSENIEPHCQRETHPKSEQEGKRHSNKASRARKQTRTATQPSDKAVLQIKLARGDKYH